MLLQGAQAASPTRHKEQELTPAARGSRSVVRQYIQCAQGRGWRPAAIACCLAACLAADDPQLKHRPPLPQNGVTEYRLEQGKRIPVKLLNTVSILTGEQDGRVYLQTVFPVVVSNHTVIPAGSYIDAKVTEVHRAGHTKGRAELNLRLGRLTLPNGGQRQLDACHGSMTASTSTHGSGVVIVPGTAADIVLQDPIVFPVEQVPNR